MSGGDFLSRWSKRKRAVAPSSPPPTVPALAPVDMPADTAMLAPVPEGEEAGLLTPEELARLPSIESLTAETDLTQFLRAGVPMLMRKAALRRMWSLDTNIRDYVSEAREYAYDWNVVGGVPGNGPMLPTDDIKAMLRDIFDGTPTAEAEPLPDDPETDGRETSEIAEADLDSDSPMGDDIADSSGHEPLPVQDSAVKIEVEPSPEAAPVARARRHGGAVPL